MLEFDKYQEATVNFAFYPEARCIEYLTMGLTSEAGEVAGKVKKILRDSDKGLADLSFHDKRNIVYEMGDVLWYLSMLAYELDYNLSDIAYHNIEQLDERRDRGQLAGSGDKR